MRSRVLALVATGALVFPLAACRDESKQICEPRTARQDLYRPGAYWLCNGDGTQEKRYQGPVPSNKPISI